MYAYVYIYIYIYIYSALANNPTSMTHYSTLFGASLCTVARSSTLVLLKSVHWSPYSGSSGKATPEKV